jgi:hypothetical protein
MLLSVNAVAKLIRNAQNTLLQNYADTSTQRILAFV